MSPDPSGPRLSRLVVAGLLAVAVAACDEAGPDVTPVPVPQSTAPGPTPTSARPPSLVPGSRPVAAADLCGFLRGKLPEWRAVGGEGAAQAQLAIDLFTFYQKQGAVPAGRDIDEQTRAQCPEVRRQVLAAAGIDSFLIL
ncbi:hypothetical protein GCM10020358_05140 [Amorphoplanes nipponensis]|uniref:Uncharacterized protein n=1 Tax=Actinoplanes nipponensis TaxID=135950 RepID=A0A919MQ87_9ACTN|nr:hypothetical protein [Actinoplanes nipponensis]GIE50298.1 hypothetical protein Ani05nite_38320 [Actinoplanes nipponensis]